MVLKPSQSQTFLMELQQCITFMITLKTLEWEACPLAIQTLYQLFMDQMVQVSSILSVTKYYYHLNIYISSYYSWYFQISGHISVALNDDKIDGGETYFIIGCFDNNGYTGFHYVGETRADSELYCPDIAWSYTTGAPLTDAPLLVYGCANPQWEGDGYCDDTNNNDVCNYDGGDCCGDNVNMNYCSACQCLDPDYTHHPTEPTVVCENPQFIGDGYCDDHLNIHDCTYDGGDCCGPAVQTNYCSDCQCLDFNYVNYDTTAAPVSGMQYMNNLFFLFTAAPHT